MKFTNENNQLENFDSFPDFLDRIGNKKQKPLSRKEHKTIEERYANQLNIKVKSYYDGMRNIIQFIN